MTPVTIVGGFLGAGKTTLVNHLLRTATRRYAVLVNDFGALSVDAGLIVGAQAGLVSLANGCVCCSIGPDLGTTLASLAARDPAPQHILIEASGVSDPWRVAQLVKLEPELALDAVLVLVDAAAFPGQLADRYLTDTLERQLARADLIVLNKCDLADPAAALAAVARIRPNARVAQVANAALPELLVTGAGHPPPSRFSADTPGHAFQTWLWPDPAPFHRDRLTALMDALPDSVLRLKGVCAVAPQGSAALLQVAGRRWSLTDWHLPLTGLVMIGTAALPGPAELERLFRAALA